MERGGSVMCKDVGPYKCLLTFGNKMIKEEAKTYPSLLSIFVELGVRLNFVWSLVQITTSLGLTGFSVHLWSREIFKSISKLCGKFIFEDDVTREVGDRTFQVLLLGNSGSTFTMFRPTRRLLQLEVEAYRSLKWGVICCKKPKSRKGGEFVPETQSIC
ncbi:hypothetical protein PIB30_085457 [Stylosanthes scabra]|uniref:Uncharacterized protein n=1 Tax=Stylosanthes scabra TaxID=79078 RepID=A0ABU6RTF7_9FABA|nr:hypothetical protein [Stylosanthes scabra]